MVFDSVIVDGSFAWDLLSGEVCGTPALKCLTLDDISKVRKKRMQPTTKRVSPQSSRPDRL